MTVKVSVLMAVHNGEKYIRQAVESILSQTFSDFEFIIVDDGSSDETVSLLDEYVAIDERIVLVRNEVNIGLTRSLNYGLGLARGEFIARMDADDISLPDRFLEQVEYLSLHPEVGVLGTFFRIIDANGSFVSDIYSFPADSGFIKWSFFFYNPIVHPSVMVRRQIVDSVGGYDPRVLRSQDKDLWVRLFWKTQFGNIPQALVHLRKHNTNISVEGYSTGLINNAFILSRLASQLVGYEVTSDCMLSIYSNNYPSEESILTGVRVISDLYFSFLDKVEYILEDRDLIRRDVYNRINALLSKLHPDLAERIIHTNTVVEEIMKRRQGDV